MVEVRKFINGVKRDKLMALIKCDEYIKEISDVWLLSVKIGIWCRHE